MFEAEAVGHSTELCRRYNFDGKGRYALLKAVVEENEGSKGFRYDSRRSSPTNPVFSKQVAADWDLISFLDNKVTFNWTPLEGHFGLDLVLCSRTVARISKVKLGEVLRIVFRPMIPRFGNAYWVFRSVGELETAIKAHLCFYNLVAGKIEGACKSIL